jgi:hypothetical protein
MARSVKTFGLADAILFSKFHFHRVFQRQVGIPLYDYIRKRRLASAASLVLNIDISIFNISLVYCVLDVPPDEAILNFGILLYGKGQVWLDNVSLQRSRQTYAHH